MKNKKKIINIKLEETKEGKCRTFFCDEGQKVIDKFKKMKEEGKDFNIESCDVVEKAFLAMINALYGISLITNFEEE